MKIGFTGTREGMSAVQKAALYAILEGFDALWAIQDDGTPENEFHHGDCVGADDEAAHIAAGVAMDYILVCHPPEEEKLRAFTDNAETRAPLPYKERNQAIVDECDILIAAPKHVTGLVAGGTWQTINMARKAGKPVVILDRGLE